MSKWTPSSEAMVLSISSWFQLLEGVDAIDDQRRVRLEVIDGLGQRRAGRDALAHRRHPLLDAVQLGPTELVGVVEVEIGAGEVAGRPGRSAPGPTGSTGVAPGRYSARSHAPSSR